MAVKALSRSISARSGAMHLRRAPGPWAVLFVLLLSSAFPSEIAPANKAPNNGLVQLGNRLFHSPLLSGDGSVSCSTCHLSALGFSGDRPLAVGVASYVSGRRAPALLGLGSATNLMWDGRASDLFSQVTMPLESPEMAIHWPAALSNLRTDPVTTDLTHKAGFLKLDRDAVLKALVAYVASLDAGPSRFDRFYYGHDINALTPQEAWGLRLFIRKARCSSCHLVNSRSAPFTDNAFHATGIGRVAGSYKDRGRAAITENPADEGAFRTPSLRGVALRPYLMHDGSMTSLHQVVEHYNRGLTEGTSKRDDRLEPLLLSSDEVSAIVAFLGALTPEGLANRSDWAKAGQSSNTSRKRE